MCDPIRQQSRPRFHAIELEHRRAIEELYLNFPFLRGRMEIHLPYSRAKNILSNDPAWVWAKFDKRPTSYLIFLKGFPVCLWSPDRQEGQTFRWMTPPNFTENGATVCLANLLTGESVLQIEDILISKGQNIWSHQKFSERWRELLTLWDSMPTEQPLLTFKPRLVEPILLRDWKVAYDASLSWIIQTNSIGQPRWFWWDVVTPRIKREYRAPTIQRYPGIPTMAVAEARPHSTLLPDTYTLFSSDGKSLGVAAVSGIELSQELRTCGDKFLVEVTWMCEFNKFRIVRIMPLGSPVAPQNTFLQIQKLAEVQESKKASQKNNDTE
jgi:hypothetical protein